jgi:predicted HicB family RNase H-like nuclease
MACSRASSPACATWCTFRARPQRSSSRAFRDSIDVYLDFCTERGEAPDKPYSGKVMVRIPPDLHRKAATRAEAEDMSPNAWIARQIEVA